jgi:hypothetical protein
MVKRTERCSEIDIDRGEKEREEQILFYFSAKREDFIAGLLEEREGFLVRVVQHCLLPHCRRLPP